jgi:glucose/arabinose dehydrogenase
VTADPVQQDVRMRDALPLLLLACALTGAAGATGARTSLPAVSGVAVPPGFHVQLYAQGLKHPTALAFGPDGRLYASEQDGDVVSFGAGARVPRVLLHGLATPLGLAWRGERLYVSTTGKLLAFTLRDAALVGRRTILAGLPAGEHQQDGIVVGLDERLYLGSGSTCDVCTERNRRSAAILSLRPDGSDLHIEATGLRNPYGLALDADGTLYATVNGADKLDKPGDPEPAEMLVRVEAGAFYGWPGCYPSARLLRMSGVCRGVTAPVAFLEPHSSADGLVFYDGASFPKGFRGNAFVAEWGTYFGKRFGRKVVRIQLRAGAPARVTTFAGGIAHPLALALDPRGALLVADWETGRILRIQADGRA